MTPMENDPLWKLRHALAGVALALLLYVVVGAGVLFAMVARHETRPLSGGRLLRWLASLWLWPLLLAANAARGAR